MGTVTPSSWALQGQGLCSGLEVESLLGGFMSLPVPELLMALLHHDLCIISCHSLLTSSGLSLLVPLCCSSQRCSVLLCSLAELLLPRKL